MKIEVICILLCVGKREQDCAESIQLGRKPSTYFLKDQVGHVSPLHHVYKTIEVEGLTDQSLDYQNIEELFEDIDSDILDTILLNGPIETVKNKLKLIREQGTDMHGVYRPFFHLFFAEQALNFLNFIH